MASAHRPNVASTAYEDDYAAWAFNQAMLLRAGQVQALDRAWIAEELDSLGRREFDRLESALRLMLLHMLKWDHQPERRSRSWTITIATQRDRVARQLDDNPSLRNRIDEVTLSAYRTARREASGETDLPLKRFSTFCPYSWDEITERRIAWHDDEETPA